MLQVKVSRTVTSPQFQKFESVVTVHGFDKLTPRAARAALEIAFGQPYGGEVRTLAQPDPETGKPDYSQIYGYRVYENSARKVGYDEM